jgi:hypothetical protein
MDIFLEEHKRFLHLLLKHEVNFMLVAGYAVIVYGYARGTSDMDNHLIQTKISTGRAQDKADVEILQKIHQHKTETKSSSIWQKLFLKNKS